MGRSVGRADLPLHGGRVPKWLAERMARLGAVAVEALVLTYGRDEVLRRLAHPFWFQSLGCVMGMDWHSSGITTSVLGALKRGLAPLRDELGIEVCGGRGRHSRATPDELLAVGQRWGLDGEALAGTSRMVAKVDNAAVQDGFQIYLHGFIVAADGQWAVVQQGMATERGLARRYHWLSEGLESFVDDPHAAIDGPSRGEIINLADRRAAAARSVTAGLVAEGPDRVLAQYRAASAQVAKTRSSAAAEHAAKTRSSAAAEQCELPHLFMPHHHEVRPENIVERRLHGALASVWVEVERSGEATLGFESLLSVPGVGARTLASLALISEVLHGAPSRFSDPARFALAHGGKDGHPFPVPLKVYDAALTVYRDAIDKAKLGRDEKLQALRRLGEQAQRLEAWATADGRFASVGEYIAQERRDSWRYGGMTVDGPAIPTTSTGPLPAEVVSTPAALRRTRRAPRSGVPTKKTRQLSLPGV